MVSDRTLPAGALTHRRFPSPVGGPANLTRLQAGYLAALMVLGIEATTEELATTARCDLATVRNWRSMDARFREAEQEVLRALVSGLAHQAAQTVGRLLNADKDHGSKGLATALTAAKWALEGSGIVSGPSAAPVRSALSPLGAAIYAPAESHASLTVTAPELDAEWTALEPAARAIVAPALPLPRVVPEVRGSRANRDKAGEGRALRKRPRAGANGKGSAPPPGRISSGRKSDVSKPTALKQAPAKLAPAALPPNPAIHGLPHRGAPRPRKPAPPLQA